MILSLSFIQRLYHTLGILVMGSRVQSIRVTSLGLVKSQGFPKILENRLDSIIRSKQLI